MSSEQWDWAKGKSAVEKAAAQGKQKADEAKQSIGESTEVAKKDKEDTIPGSDAPQPTLNSSAEQGQTATRQTKQTEGVVKESLEDVQQTLTVGNK